MWKLLYLNFLHLSFSTSFSYSQTSHCLTWVTIQRKSAVLCNISCTPSNNYTCEHFKYAFAADILVAGILLSCFFVFLSPNNPWRWISGPSNDADQITAIIWYNHAHSRVCTKRLFIWNRSLQIIYRLKPQIIWCETYCFSCKWELLLILDAFECFTIKTVSALCKWWFKSGWLGWLRSNNHNKCLHLFGVITKYSNFSQFGRASKNDSQQSQSSIHCSSY